MLSVLIPVYNYDVTALIDELNKQCTAANIPFEIIVCDDNSLAEFKLENKSIDNIAQVKYLQNNPNLGRTATRKKLAEAARYDNLLFLDADVIPVSDTFIADYLPYLNKKIAVFGGYAYRDIEVQCYKVLRFTYGRKREENPADFRNKTPYGAVFSGNFLIERQQFFENNYPGNENFYGMDIYFGYSMHKNNVNVLHIDNPIYHLGLEEDSVFFAKSLQAVDNRKLLLQQYPGMAVINNLLKHYTRLKKYRLSGIVALLFKATAPLLKKAILSKKPNLIAFDLYRLGYICAVK